jgi:20S proteasome alpha/beta subunit
MTTIVWDGARLAADSQVTDNGMRCGTMTKIGKTADGWLWGFCGKAARQAAFVAWAESREGDPPVAEETTALLVNPDGELREWDGGWLIVDAKFQAFGSGYQVALGALASGKTAREAVETACQFDTMSSAPIISLRPGAEQQKVAA